MDKFIHKVCTIHLKILITCIGCCVYGLIACKFIALFSFFIICLCKRKFNFGAPRSAVCFVFDGTTVFFSGYK